jgi:riboflavin biosynthesis pyrimidine reductase
MRQLLPTVLDAVDPDELYAGDARPAPAGRPWVLTNMIASVDGAASVDGLSGPLGGPGDRAVFRALRALADVILVGAGTARAEHYRPPKPSLDQQGQRVARGQAPIPRIAVVSGRLALDLSSPLFTESPNRPYVITGTQPSPKQLARASDVAEVIVAGADSVDLTAGLAALGRAGAGVVLCEGGATLSGQLLAGGLIDEACVTIAPLLAGGDAGRIMHGTVLDRPQPMRLDRVLEEDAMLFLRYVRATATD